MKRYNILGRHEFIDIPVFGIKKLKVKIDTGAYTSSIDCSEIVEEHGKLCFKILDPSHDQYKSDRLYVFDSFKKVKVKSSNGHEEERYLIDVTIFFDSLEVKTEFTLAKRKDMEFPILIGRKSIPEGTLVDVHYSPVLPYVYQQ